MPARSRRAMVLEELGRADQSVAVTVSVSGSLAGGMIARLGTDEQKDRWLPALAAGSDPRRRSR